MKHIVLYGGAFDPPHVGHVVAAAHALLEHPTIDLLVVAPSFEHVEKGSAGMASFNDRLRMCDLTFAGLPKTQVSFIESQLGGRSFTARTLEALRDRYPEARLSLLCGPDTAARVPQWERGDDVLRLADLIVVPRAPMSSTEVRNAVGNGRLSVLERACHKRVADYIITQSLYDACPQTVRSEAAE